MKNYYGNTVKILCDTIGLGWADLQMYVQNLMYINWPSVGRFLFICKSV